MVTTLYSKYFLVLHCLLAIILIITFSGCGPLYQNLIDPIIPKKPVPAEYDLTGKTVLVWVDLNSTNTSHGQIRRILTDSLIRELMANHAIGSAIPYRQITQLRLSPELVDMNIDDLGRQLKANEVLYVLINEFSLHPESTTDIFDSSLNGYCKVIRSEDGERVWPGESLYRTFKIKGRFTTENNPDLENQLTQELCDKTASQLAMYFYEHKP